ncbi:hypothetical protein D9M72_405220 [compost metagenome]
MKREPKFPVGSVVRVEHPEAFIDEKKLRDRDAIVLENMEEPIRSGLKEFRGRVRVEFQKRNGRGKVFTDVMNERWFTAKEAS